MKAVAAPSDSSATGIPAVGGGTGKAGVAIRTEVSSARKPRPKDSELVFGRLFTDHMAMADWTEADGWKDPRVVPYGNFSLDPASAVFHYSRGGDGATPA